MTVQLFLRKPVAPRSCSVSSWSFAMCVGVVLDLVVWLRHFTNEITVSGLVGSNVVQGPIPEPASCCLRHTLSNLKKHISWVQGTSWRRKASPPQGSPGGPEHCRAREHHILGPHVDLGLLSLILNFKNVQKLTGNIL